MKKEEINQLVKILFFNAKKESYKSKEIILREGEKSNKFYFIEKGILRGWTNKDGKEITFQFMFENNLFCSSESFFLDSPSSYNIETINNCTLFSVEKKEIYKILEDEKFLRLFNKYIINRLANYQQLLIARIKDKPEERYKNLLKEHPEIILNIPQHYIASYLGVTSVSLSRIRNR